MFAGVSINDGTVEEANGRRKFMTSTFCSSTCNIKKKKMLFDIKKKNAWLRRSKKILLEMSTRRLTQLLPHRHTFKMIVKGF